MKNALIVGYFRVDAALADFYNTYAVKAKSHGFEVSGIDLGEGRIRLALSLS